MIRLAKVAVIAALAAFALIVAYNNVFDYNSNYQFVRHVLSMDTTFPDSALRPRAIDSETLCAAYAVIISTEASTGLLLALGDARLLPVVFRFYRDRRRVFCHVAVENLERTGRRLPHRHNDARRIDFCRPA
jgi:predicted small integral membrane protein